MIDESISEFFKTKESSLDFNRLFQFMVESGIEFRDRDINGALGIATYYCIYLDINKVKRYNEKALYFVVLHEMAHFKRISKVGKDETIRLMSLDDFEDFCNHIVNEEIIADRYACYIYYKFNTSSFPRAATQQLHLPHNKKDYRMMVEPLFGKINNKEENYRALLESFIYETE